MGTLYDRRTFARNKPVWEYTLDQMTWTAAGTDADTETIAVNGIIKQIVITIGTTTNNITFTVAVADADGNSLYSVAALADATTHVKAVTTDFAEGQICGNGFIVTVTPSGAAGASGATVDIILRGL